ncbi:amidohydrolase family protein [Arthrobacter sp. Sa2CUA1]|uniref:Amidohydrolase family protein n=1 Tax=Arthrobacter gallicola TaxID=2762225 RepID=A0ABR8UT42_9MICC|nr:amidohydrolase family protein [Arthrobacter gallicola]MBD7995722.1 amidohydrolase family protein [Arthrobacter gallicola]
MEAAALRILDAHHHFWNFEGDGYYPWLQGEYNENFFLGDYTGMLQTFLPEQYGGATAGYSVVGTVHVEAERARDQEVAETRFLESLHGADSRFPAAIVAHATLARQDAAEVLAQQAASPLVRGIRSKPVTSPSTDRSVFGEPGTLQDPRFIEGLALLETHGLSWDLRVPYWHLSEAAEVVEQFPGITVIINHCGLPLDRSADGIAAWRVGMEALAALPNTAVKVSELGLPRNRWDRASNEAVVADTVAIFGYERSMFASNLPVATLTAPTFGEVVDTVLAALPSASREQLDRLFSETAAEYYNVDLSTLT